jgi:hypothetical protein
MLISFSGRVWLALLFRFMAEMTLCSTRPTDTVPCPAAKARSKGKLVAGLGCRATSMALLSLWRYSDSGATQPLAPAMMLTVQSRRVGQAGGYRAYAGRKEQ